MTKHILNKLFLIAGLCTLGTLAACGGGGGSAGTSVFDTSASGVNGPVAADLILQVNSSELANTGTSTVALTVTAVDANRQTVSGAPVSLGASGDAIVSATSTATDTDGKVVGTVATGSNRANRVITVTATSGTVTRSLSIQVVGASLNGTAVPSVVLPGGAGKVTFSLTDKLNAKIAGQPVQIVATQVSPGTIAGVTDINGEFVYNYTAPANAAGAAEITATAGGATNTQVVQVGALTVPDATLTIDSADVQAIPSVVAVNQPGSNANRAEIRARFVAVGNLPVPNVRVKFDLGANASGADGTFSSGNDVIYSNASGIATTSYTPKTRSSPTNGVRVRACYGPTDASLVGCPTFREVTLTVSSEPVGVTIGYDATIAVVDRTYVKTYVVSVVDSAGRPMAGVSVNPLIQLIQYGRGEYQHFTAVAPAIAGWRKVTSFTCASEDLDSNTVLGSGEDLNKNGRLDPGPSDVSIQLLHPLTRADGTAELTIQYPQNYATWVTARITVTASVAGTESRHSILVAPLPALNTAITNQAIPPAFVVSPYGTTADCTSLY